MRRVSGDQITWSENNINELRDLLRQGQIVDDEDIAEQKLTYPWPVDVVKTSTISSASGAAYVNALLEFDEVPDASDYEIRSSIYSRYLDIPPVTEWSLNGEAVNLADHLSVMYGGGRCTAILDLVAQCA